MVNLPINLGFILFPLYIYPSNNAWAPLFTAAKSYPNLTFLAVVNPDSGPGMGACPDSVYTTGIHTLNSYTKIVALGYVHTSASSTCGPSHNLICPASRPQADLQAEIDKYQNWSSLTGCSPSGSPSIKVNGIFFDEAPTEPSSVPYMQTISAYARRKLTHGATIVNNPGAAVDPGYWNYADFIIVFEDTEAAYRQANIATLTGNGVHAQNAILLIHTYKSNLQTEKDDVDTIIDTDYDGIAGVFISELRVTPTTGPYNAFPARWTQLVHEVDAAN